jgi:eukaryotic-like serine/threonine-protein kinase
MADFIPGHVLAQGYRLEQLIDQGGMGAVWAGVRLPAEAPVALKFVRGSKHSPEFTRRLLREARVGGAIKHRNLVSVLDVFEVDPGQPVIVMELLRGETLRAKLARELQLSLGETVELFLPVVSAVGTAHAAGVIHRDLKPDNVFLAHEGGDTVPKVLDFGVAKLTASHGAMAESSALTRDGAMVGTPAYMAPEQLAGDPVDHRADIWAIGVMLYECLAGGRPLEACGRGQMLRLILTVAITPLEVVAPHVPPDISHAVMQMLVRQRDDRLSDLSAIRQTLEQHSSIRSASFGPPAQPTA